MTRLRVHLMVHSGLPSPVVELDEDASADVLDALAPDRELTGDDLGLPPPWHLGYRGLVVEQVVDPDARLPREFEYGTDALRGRNLHHHVAESLTDERLLGPDGPIGRALPDRLVETLPALLRAARAAPRATVDAVDQPPATCGASAPNLELDWWNDGGLESNSHQRNNNCYNYATNQRTDTFAQPGWGSGLTLPDAGSGDTVRLYAWYDNLYDAPAANNTCTPEGHLVALAFAPSLLEPDYHWWRKDRSGYWSGKAGPSAASDRDHSGNLITDPRTCNRGVYTTFVGFMTVMPGRVRLAGPGYIPPPQPRVRGPLRHAGGLR